MVRKIVSSLFVLVWVSVILYLRDVSAPNLVILASIACVWFVLVFLPEKKYFLWLKKLDYRIVSALDGFFGEKVLFFQVWFLCFVCFLLSYIAFFPGIFGYDAPSQFAMYMGKIPFDSAQQPLLHTLFIGAVINLGKGVLGSYQAGFALLILIQGLFITNCMALTFHFLKKRNVPLIIILAGMIWVGLNPCIQVLNCNVTKDVMFGVFLTYFLMAVIHVCEKEKSGVFDILALSASGVFMCLFRNGLVLSVAVLLIFCLLFKIKKVKVYLTLTGIILFVEIFSFSAKQFWGIEKTPSKEFMSVPIQQLAYTMYLDENSPGSVNLSEVEREMILELFSDEEKLLNTFVISTADGPKSIFQEEVFRKAGSRYLTLYWNVGQENRNVYTEAWLNLIRPYFNMNVEENNRRLMLSDFFTLFFDRSEVDIHRSAKYLEGYRDYLEKSVSGDLLFWEEPVLSFLMIGIFLGFGLARKKREYVLTGLVLLTYFAGILFGPVALMRYAYPIMLSTPLMFGLMFGGAKYMPENEKQEKLLEEVKKS